MKSLINAAKTGITTKFLTPELMLLCQGHFLWRRYFYWFRGSYGNFLLGCPILTQEIKDILAKQGGLFRIIPLSEDCLKEGVQYFRFFGCSFVLPEVDGKATYDFPVLKADPLAITGVNFLQGKRYNGTYSWRFTWRHKTIATPDLSQTDDIPLGNHRPPADSKVINNPVAVSKTSYESATSILSRLLSAEPKLVMYAHDDTRSIIAFDDIEFENNDYEGLTPMQRQQLHNAMMPVGFLRQTGHQYLGYGVNIIFCQAPRALGSDLNFGIPDGESAFRVVTATQGAFLIGNQHGKNEVTITQELELLCSVIPVNTRKLGRSPPPPGWEKENWQGLWKKIGLLQKETINYYRIRKTKGLIGKMRSAPRVK